MLPPSSSWHTSGCDPAVNGPSGVEAEATPMHCRFDAVCRLAKYSRQVPSFHRITPGAQVCPNDAHPGRVGMASHGADHATRSPEDRTGTLRLPTWVL